MADKTENMVLRTVYLPKSLDNRLKNAAFGRSQSKGELIRDLISISIDRLEESGTFTAKKSSPASKAKKVASPTTGEDKAYHD
ncbi:MAG: hypothetical protein V7774_08135 [Pseudorhizobium pelagicum]|uniref:hypothetical protein n=1 Tax=Pseudorhizobium pelagicum TaxID=1509405 RepID=UPI0034608960